MHGYTSPTDLPEICPIRTAILLRTFSARGGDSDVDTSDLDPTQMAAFDAVHDWAEERKDSDDNGKVIPTPIRLALLGAAGSGKTRLIAAMVRDARNIFGRQDAVVVTAHTGVAASNVGCGGRTIAGLFRTMGDEEPIPLRGAFLADLQRQLSQCRLLIVDEISMVWSQQLAAVSVRLQQATGLEPAFGACGVVFSGDFAHLPPIGKKSLIHDGAPERCSAASRLGHAGRRFFKKITACVRLRVVYRQGEPCPFKESTLRLRDCAMTLADYDLWASRDVMRKDICDPGLVESSDEFLWLSAENANSGERNGNKLGQLAKKNGVPILRYHSLHSEDAAARKRPGEFKGLRTLTRVAIGAPVMLIANKLFGVDTAPLGLMNGARGTVVGVRHSPGSAPPDLPDYVVVYFPDYKGDPIFPGVGREKWPPVPLVEARGKGRKELARTAVPLILCWATSIVKSQGLTLREVHINLVTKSGKSPLRLPGAAYVAFTRVTSLEGWACRGIPPIQTFINGRQHEQRRYREKYEAQTDALHEEFMLSAGVDPEAELMAHRSHLESQTMKRKGRAPTDAEFEEREGAIRKRGVLPIPPDVLAKFPEIATGRRGALFRGTDVFKAFASGAHIPIGAKLSELVRKPTLPKNAPAPSYVDVLRVDGSVFESIREGGASAIGAPLLAGPKGFRAGAILTLENIATAEEAKYTILLSVSGNKGFRAMMRSPRVGPWGAFLPFSKSKEEAEEYYANRYAESKTCANSGRWAAALLAPAEQGDTHDAVSAGPKEAPVPPTDAVRHYR